MSLEVSTIKILGGTLVGASSVGGGAYAIYHFRDKLFSSVDSYLLLTGTSTDGTETTEALFKNDIKNYSCLVDTKEYDCDFLKDPTNLSTKKQAIYSKDLIIKSSDETSVKTNIKTSNNKNFLVKIDDSFFNAHSTFSDQKDLKVVVKGQSTKVFGNLKIAAGKNKSKYYGKFNTFLVKGESFAGTDTDFDVSSGSFKCRFNNWTADEKKVCKIYKFSDSQNPLKNYLDLDFLGSETEFTGNTSKIEKGKYYLIKFTTDADKFENEKIFNNLQLTKDNTNDKLANLSSVKPVVLGSETSNKTLYILA